MECYFLVEKIMKQIIRKSVDVILITIMDMLVFVINVIKIANVIAAEMNVILVAE